MRSELVTFLFALAIPCASRALQAQSAAAPSAASSAAAPDPYARYTRPGQCAQAAHRLNDQYWRDKRADTVIYGPATDSVPASVIAAAKICAARFSMTKIPSRDLLGLVDLYLWTHQDSLAHSAAERLVAASSAQLPSNRGWILYQIVRSYLSARPVQLAVAKRYLTQLDALSAPAAPWRLFAHTLMSRYMMSLDDTSAALAEANAALTAGTQMDKNDRADRVFALLDAYHALAEPTSLRFGGPAAVAVFDSAMRVLLPLRAPHPGNTTRRKAPTTLGTGDVIVRGGTDPVMAMALMMGGMGASMGGPDAQMMLQQAITESQRPYTIVGKPAPPLQASHWYAAGTDTGPRPKPGAVTLLFSAAPNCGAVCFPMYASLRRIYDTYHAAGLQIILMSSTSGFFRNQPAPVPAKEVEEIRAYYLDFLKLPGVLGVDETQFSHRPDGRRVNTPRQSREDYFRGINAVVVGKSGTVLFADNLTADREQVFRAVIGDALKQ